MKTLREKLIKEESRLRAYIRIISRMSKNSPDIRYANFLEETQKRLNVVEKDLTLMNHIKELMV